MTYVLVHGGGSSGRFWDRLIPLLDEAALAIDMPGRNGKPGDLGTITVDEEVASALGDIEAAAPDGPIVLVAHSSGGLIVPGVVVGLKGRVTHVVLIAALVPPEGGNGLTGMKPKYAEGLSWAHAESLKTGDVITTPGAPEDPEAFRDAYGGDSLDDDSLAFLTSPDVCVSDTVNHYFQPVHWSTAADVPVTYVLTERDRPVPTALQEEMVARLPQTPTVIRIDTGHVPPVTHPNEIAAILAAVE